MGRDEVQKVDLLPVCSNFMQYRVKKERWMNFPFCDG